MAHVVFLAFCVLLGVTLTEVQLTSTYVAPNTRNHCFLCPAGTRVKKHCPEDLTYSACAPCPSGYYSDTPNSKTYCKACRAHCPKSGSVTQNCTATTDLGCRCNDGYHKYPIDHIDPRWTCRKHTSCKEGEGEVFRGNYTHNTKCEKCKENEQFVNKSDPNHPVCQTCTICAPGIPEAKKCSLDHDRECDESQNGTYVDVTRTVPSVTTTADQPSGSLSGAVIFGIVYGVLVVAGIIAGAGLYILTKRNNRIQITEREKIAVVLAIVTGFGLPVVIILLIQAYRHGRGSSEQTYTAVSLANGDAIDAAVGDAPGDSAVRDAPGDSAVGDAPGDSAVRDAAGDSAVGDAPGDSAVRDAAGDAAVGDAAAGDAAVGDAAPLLDWSLDFIEGRVFPFLSTYLGNEWRMFITELPGWRPNKASAVIEQSMLDERLVKDQIFACLKAWKQQCTQKVTRRNILSTLEAPGVERMDLKQELETMSATSA